MDFSTIVLTAKTQATRMLSSVIPQRQQEAVIDTKTSPSSARAGNKRRRISDEQTIDPSVAPSKGGTTTFVSTSRTITINSSTFTDRGNVDGMNEVCYIDNPKIELTNTTEMKTKRLPPGKIRCYSGSFRDHRPSEIDTSFTTITSVVSFEKVFLQQATTPTLCHASRTQSSGSLFSFAPSP